MDNVQVARAIYKACLIAATRLGKEVERLYTSDVFSPTDVEWFLRNIPSVLSGVKNGTQGLQAVVRNEFRQSVQKTPDAVGHRLDLALLGLQICNRRTSVLTRHAVSHVSDTTTNGVRVLIQSNLVNNFPSRDPLYRYQVRISNESCPSPVQLVSRHWLITDFHGHTESVRGPGVVGHQPVLNLGEKFEYESATTIKSQRGTLAGSYHMLNPASGELFDVLVGPLALRPDCDKDEEARTFWS